MSNEVHNPPRSLWGIIGICGSVAALSAGAGWTVARGYVSDELEQIQRSKDWHLPENLAALGELSKALTLQIRERQDLDRLRQRLPRVEADLANTKQQLENEVARAKQQLAELSQRNQALAATLAASQAETFDVRAGEAHFVVPRLLAVGVKEASDILNIAEVNFGDASAQLRPGQSIKATAGGKTYKVILIRIKSDTATFAIAASP